ncbi:hypothetical protein FOL47_002552, partial [Perkinsus chesapeaki]
PLANSTTAESSPPSGSQPGGSTSTGSATGSSAVPSSTGSATTTKVDSGLLRIACCCASAVSAEAQRLLEEGHKIVDREGSPTTIERLVQGITPEYGPIPPYLIPDEKVMRVLSKSSSSYVDFKLLAYSSSEGNTRKRLRTTTSGKVVEVYDEGNEFHGQGHGYNGAQYEEQGAFNKWSAQFARYMFSICLVDPKSRQHLFTFLGYQCEISRIAVMSPYRAVEADRAFRLTVPGIAATGKATWECFSEEFTAPFFSRFLSEVAHRPRPSGNWNRSHKGKGKGKGKGYNQYGSPPHASGGGSANGGSHQTSNTQNRPNQQNR